ncbi:helix-turn-helix domain-containing protein [Amycolatopsis sp. WAC 01416]|uniref:helix-turn-helix domain-containing protein n=1 Tax=Amycolatopsis sp. WAC 01416 TaxID=2203196 RepID=UPI002693620F
MPRTGRSVQEGIHFQHIGVRAVRSCPQWTHAALVARHMVMPPHRDGGQAQFVPAPSPGDELDGLLEWAGDRLGTPLSVGDLAAHLNVSPRTLARRFADQLGTTPGAWLLTRRVTEARAPLAGRVPARVPGPGFALSGTAPARPGAMSR